MITGVFINVCADSIIVIGWLGYGEVHFIRDLDRIGAPTLDLFISICSIEFCPNYKFKKKLVA